MAFTPYDPLMPVTQPATQSVAFHAYDPNAPVAPAAQTPAPAVSTQTQAPNILAGAADAIAGAFKNAASIVPTVASAGDFIARQTAGRAANILSGQGNVAPAPNPLIKASSDALQPSNKAQQQGATGETIGETIAPIGAGVVAYADKLASAAKAAPGAIKNLALGKNTIATLKQLANPDAMQFVPTIHGGGGKTFAEGAVEPTQKAIESFVANSKAELQKVKQAIPSNIYVPPSQLATAVNDAVMSSVNHAAEYKGIAGDATMFKSPADLINSGIMTQEEAAKVKGMINVVSDWKDLSARGVLNLKEQLGSFYKDGFNGSNAVLRNVQTNLKNIVADVHPEIKPALQKASENIDMAQQFQRNLIGKDAISGESKLLSIARKLHDPAANGEKLSLLQDLQQATGHNAVPALKGFNDYAQLLQKEFPSKAGTIAKTVATRGGIGVAGLAGLEEVKRLFGI